MKQFLWQLGASLVAWVLLRPVGRWLQLPDWALITVIVLAAANLRYPWTRK